MSSTSTLGTDHYVSISDKETTTERGTGLGTDDMEGSRFGLGTGYGQTKWVSEQLVREACHHKQPELACCVYSKFR